MTSQFTSQAIFSGLKSTLHGYLEAQYHIWDDTLIRERKALLDLPGATHNQPYFEATPAYLAANTGYSELEIGAAGKAALTKSSEVPGSPIFKTPFSHQATAIERFVGQSQELVIATGTGSGKTESFLLPLLASLAEECARSPTTANMPAIRALLLYPMNALVNDQLTRLRKMVGNPKLSEILSDGRGRPIRFGMYTSRTPYAGARKRPSQDRKRLSTKFAPYLNTPQVIREQLIAEGMWPAKDMDGFAANGFNTNPSDIELSTRHEMQESPPDLLVTNYSMLEYMLMRPVERNLFAQTQDWLKADPKAFVTVILDEAHMYRGAAGAEVALLLRRFQSRLGVPRNRIKFILTSASLGEGKAAEKAAKAFAATLTGLVDGMPDFELVTGTPDYPPHDGDGAHEDIAALQHFDRTLLDLSQLPIRLPQVIAGINSTLSKLKLPTIAATSEMALRDGLFSSLWESPLVGRLARRITGKPYNFPDLLESVFPGYGSKASEALETLMSLSNFARRSSDYRVLLPIRMHTFFRGLGGLFACMNPRCSQRLDDSPGAKLLGRLYDEPRLRCSCGSRVYELLTHRDCGAAYIRGYLHGAEGNFLWHEPGTTPTGPALLESHFLAQAPAAPPSGTYECWLHLATGRIVGASPSSSESDNYVRLIRPASVVKVDRKDVLSFDCECPVCAQGWKKGRTKIMDLVTKGDAPFANLIKTQVQLQPPTKAESDRLPNGGRKSLLFSDGRQKAARLARDVPREIEKDVFRQLLIVAVAEAGSAGVQECRITSKQLYTAFLHAVSNFNLRLFDGDDRARLSADVRKYRKHYRGKLRDAFDDDWEETPPPRYSVELFRQLGNRFYSISGLTLGYVTPVGSVLRRVGEAFSQLTADEVRSICCHWLVHVLSEMAFDAGASVAVRRLAIGFFLPDDEWGLDSQESVPDTKMLAKRLRGLEIVLGRQTAKALDKLLIEEICSAKNNSFFVTPSRVAISNALGHKWFRCGQCTWLTPFALRARCPECGADNLIELNPNESDYLRARKQFWRDPINQILAGKERPFTIDVEEHTAQLGYLDKDDTSSTTEDFERCFRDILTSEDDEPVDVLSSTTTMEVGIDIGSLVAVGLRNVPPMRQNYQQRAGRAGRRGSSVSTVITYAQNSAHDAYYFKEPVEIIRGQPPLPSVDVTNDRIVVRHVHAALIQAYFHDRVQTVPDSGNLFSTLGLATSFFEDASALSLPDFRKWISSSKGASAITFISNWMPSGSGIDATQAAQQLLQRLSSPAIRPKDDEEGSLLDFLFDHGLLPTYAFPRALCALQIERRGPDGPEIEQRPQQALGVALSEYSPGRLVVVNKKTYKIGAVAASGSGVNRAEALFMANRAISYVHCHNCGYTQVPRGPNENHEDCPFCHASKLSAIEVVQPEVVYPKGAREVDEFEDDPVYSQATAAEYPAPTGPDSFQWEPLGKSRFVCVSNQSLVMVNKGVPIDGGFSGFHVCDQCGSTPPPGELLHPGHRRDYILPRFPQVPDLCSGTPRNVYLGFQFRSDLLLMRIPVEAPLLQSLETESARQPLEVALRSFSEALALGASLVLDVDPRELGCGLRFVQTDGGAVADIFLHDTASGGAGYAHLAGEHISAVLKKVGTLLSECTCDSSCKKCLRHYGNRMFHGQLDRFLALDVLEYVQSGAIPQVASVSEQRSFLAPLAQMLELADLTCSSSASVPLCVTRGVKSVSVGVYPSILDEAHSGHALAKDGLIFSKFAVERNLPGVFALICEQLG